MNQKLLVVLILLSPALGCAGLESLEVREKIYGREVPVITHSFASQQIRPNDTWKVYLNASDPDANMKYIVCTIQQPGAGVYSASYTRIKEENRKELSGYVYLNTVNPGNLLNFVNLTLTVQVQDKAGHFSQPAVYPLSLHARFTQEAPPPGVFKEEDLGPIMITLRSGRRR